MSDLTKSTKSKIHEWTRELAQTESVAPDRLQELESHLIESLLSLREKGLTEDEAFIIASSRLGSTDSLSVEFAKGDLYLWSNRVYWMCLGYLGIMLSIRLVGSMVHVVSSLAWLTTDDPIAISVAMAAVWIVGFLLIGAGVLRLARGPARFRMRFTATRFLLGITLALLISGAISVSSTVLTTRFVSPQSIGQMARHMAYFSAFSSVAVPICFALLALRLRKQRLFGERFEADLAG